MSEKRVFDFIGSNSLGVNSGVDPLILPKNQLAWMVNGTVRGDFIKHRPYFNDYDLTYVGVNCETHFQSGIFQCAQSYLSLDGNTYIMIAVGGRLFKATPNFVISQFQIEEIDLTAIGMNDPTVRINWMWQSERWLIWNDGIHLPVFFDGNGVRRSRGPADPRDPIPLLTTLTQPLTIPAKGETVTAHVNCATAAAANFTIGQPIVIGEGAHFGLFTVDTLPHDCSDDPTTDVTGRSLTTPAGLAPAGDTVVNPANLFQRDNNYMGIIHAATLVSSGAAITNWNQVPAYTPAVPAVPPTTFSIPFSLGNNTYLGGINATGQFSDWGGNPESCNPLARGLIGNSVFINGVEFRISTWGANSMNVYPVGGAGVFSGTASATFIRTTLVTPLSSSSGYQWSRICNGSSSALYMTTNIAGNFGSVTNAPGSPGTAAIPAVWPEFDLTLSRNWSGPNPNRTTPPTINIPATATVAGHIEVLEFASSNQNVIRCRFAADTRAAPPNVPSAQWLFTGGTFPPSQTWVAGTLPTAANQMVKLSSAALSATPFGSATTVITVPAAGVSDIYLLTVTQPPAAIVNGDVLFFTSSTPQVDYILVTNVSSSVPGADCCMSVKNVTGVKDDIITATSGIYQIPELPISTIGVYGLGRNWVALPDFTRFMGGDLVGSSSGTNTAPNFYQYTDAVLCVSQNQGLSQGGTFTIPTSGTKIRAMQFTAVLDRSLGQGPLQIFTDTNVFSCNAPTDITEWANMNNPILTQSLIGSGAVSQTAVVQANGDLIFRSPDGGARSFLQARLDFNKWGSTPISREAQRALSGLDPTLLPYCSMTVFNNRALTSARPTLDDKWTFHESLLSLNFDPLTTISEKQPSVWEGEWTGRKWIHVLTAFFNGVERCFYLEAKINFTTGEYSTLGIGEIAADNPERYAESNAPAVVFESPVLFKGDQHTYKRLIDGELYFSDILRNPYGVPGIAIPVTLEYKADQNSDWITWGVQWLPLEDTAVSCRPRLGFGQPSPAVMDAIGNRPMREAYTFQIRVTIGDPGKCTFLGARFAADEIPQPSFSYPKT